jgi:hypothetical protein
MTSYRPNNTVERSALVLTTTDAHSLPVPVIVGNPNVMHEIS